MPTPAAPNLNVSTRPVRVMHLTGNLDRGGIETWLTALAESRDPARLQMDVMILSPDPHPGLYEPRLKAAGVEVIHLPPTGQLARFVPALRRALRQAGPYDVIHSHVHHFGALALWAAQREGIPVRAVTSHNDTSDLDAQAGPARRAYLWGMRQLMLRAATHPSAVSPEAAQSLFGAAWPRGPVPLMTLGIDLAAVQRVRSPQQIAALKAELGLTGPGPVIGCVAQLRSQKNHSFLLEIMREYLGRHGPATLLLIGEGPQRPQIEAQIEALGLGEHVRLLGSRPDVPDLLWVMDAFALASHFEGLGLAAIEALASGLPAVIADTLPIRMDDPRFGSSGIHVLALEQGPAVWADALAAAAAKGRRAPPPMDFDVRQTAQDLTEWYRRAAGLAP